LRDIARLLETSRLVTLVGPGGIGKTRLALDVPDAVLVDLSSLTDPALVAVEIARTLGVPDQSWLSFLRAKELLLVLDNFEQVAAAAPLVDDLLSGAPGVSLLVTSRVPLRVAAECLYRVPSTDRHSPSSLLRRGRRCSRRVRSLRGSAAGWTP
jgi:predicted ATPase